MVRHCLIVSVVRAVSIYRFGGEPVVRSGLQEYGGYGADQIEYVNFSRG